MNVTEKQLETRIADLERELDAANQLIEELKQSYEAAFAQWQFQRENVNEAERKLVTATDSLGHIAKMRKCRSANITGPLRDLHLYACAQCCATEALAQIEQPHIPPIQQLPGEDPPFEMCQCSACVALRTMKAGR